MKGKIIVLTGPTASGKTAASIELAHSFGGEVVNADSMQIYKYMDIGTAKPTLEERCGVPHHMLDVVEPWEGFSVAKYCQMANDCIRDCLSRGKVPVLTGGTGMYIDALLYNTLFDDGGANPEYRAELNAVAEQNGNEALQTMLQKVDPEAAERIQLADRRRLIRALEVFHQTGVPISQQQRRSRLAPKPYSFMAFAMEWEREALYQRIEKRVDIMLEQGLVQEVERLMEMGVGRDTTAMQGIGYKEVYAYLRGESGYLEMVELLKRATRRYAKRQLTWFRRNKDIIWIKSVDTITKLLRQEEFLP